MKKRVFLISGVRSTVAPAGGCLRHIPVHKLSSAILLETLRQIHIRKEVVDDVWISNALGGGGNIARLCVLEAGFSSSILGTTVDRQCVGGLDVILQASNRIRQGEANLILAGGVESYSLRPERHYDNKWNTKPVPQERPSFFPNDDPTLPLSFYIQKLRHEYQISPEDEFEWTKQSHAKALLHKKLLSNEIHHLHDFEKADPFSREITWGIYKKSEQKFGHTHPCNTAPKADGAAFVALASEDFVKKHSPKFCIEIVDGFTMGGDPQQFPLLPATAMKQVLSQNSLQWSDIHHIELMEAYAAQAILCTKLSGAPIEKINPHGGSISRGHPIGASGAILALHLFHFLKNQNDRTGLAAIAGAGGLASVLLVKS